MSFRQISLIPLLAVLLAVLATSVKAHSNGMDMTMDGAMDLEAGQMLTYLHFTPGDIVLFYGWVPSSKGAMVGTCIGLFLFALVERWIAACRGVMEAHWRKRWVQRFLRRSYTAYICVPSCFALHHRRLSRH